MALKTYRPRGSVWGVCQKLIGRGGFAPSREDLDGLGGGLRLVFVLVRAWTTSGDLGRDPGCTTRGEKKTGRRCKELKLSFFRR